jgi:hypothetical protein
MKRKSIPFIYFVSILVLVSLACGAFSGGSGDAPPSSSDNSAPPATNTSAPIPTQKPTNTPRPTAVPTEGPKDFFTEEFEDDTFMDHWFYFSFGPGGDNDSNLQIFQDGDGLTIDLGALDFYLYYMYEPFTYNNVKLTLVAENQGRNNNNVSLVCQMDYDNAEWYEFSVESGGVWYLYVYKDGYKTLDNGGVNALNQGQAINEYGLTCEDNKITMSVNDTVLKTYTDLTYVLDEGLVGFNISSLNVLPITVNVKSFDIAQP